MAAEEETLDLFFGLNKNDLMAISEMITLGLISFIIFAAIVTFIAYVLSRIFEKNDGSMGILAFVVAGFSFIPIFGIFYGLSGITWGLLTTKNNGKVLAFASFGGIVFNVLLIVTPIIVISNW